jgi:hypothetical protein
MPLLIVVGLSLRHYRVKEKEPQLLQRPSTYASIVIILTISLLSKSLFSLKFQLALYLSLF